MVPIDFWLTYGPLGAMVVVLSFAVAKLWAAYQRAVEQRDALAANQNEVFGKVAEAMSSIRDVLCARIGSVETKIDLERLIRELASKREIKGE